MESLSICITAYYVRHFSYGRTYVLHMWQQILTVLPNHLTSTEYIPSTSFLSFLYHDHDFELLSLSTPTAKSPMDVFPGEQSLRIHST